MSLHEEKAKADAPKTENNHRGIGAVEVALRGGRQGQKSGPSIVSRDNCLGLLRSDKIQPFIRAFLT
ncbi:hypothetical protein J6590_099747, partial [Homalodisca vitripennis]